MSLTHGVALVCNLCGATTPFTVYDGVRQRTNAVHLARAVAESKGWKANPVADICSVCTEARR